MKLILVTNDDGIGATGLRMLANAMMELPSEVKTLVVAPTSQRSAGGKSITYSTPLRLSREIDLFDNKISAYSVDGTPADCVIMGKYVSKKEFGKIPDLIVSGINSGGNSSVQSILASGTCAAAFEGGISGIPSIAFSLEVPESELFSKPSQSASNYEVAAIRAKEIASKVLLKGLPSKVLFLNCNFPSSVSLQTPIDFVPLAPEKYIDEAIEQKDPRGVPIYWIWGDLISNLQENTDVHSLSVKKMITLTPISLEFRLDHILTLKKWFSEE
ncbi:MAG: 5'/3'-nucleotidase SurE [Candidatus Heimdallarchaeota archaeon]